MALPSPPRALPLAVNASSAPECNQDTRMPARNVRDTRPRMLFGDVVDGVMRLDA